MTKLGKFDFLLADVAFFYHSRLKAHLSGLVMTIRDYPFEFVRLSFAEFQS
jgi:hypothetical protein